jgi:hypothetical protein
VPVVPEVWRAIGAPTGIAQYAISDTGTLVYVKGAADAQASLALADRAGNRKRLASSPTVPFHPRFNHDDSRIAVNRSDEGVSNIWIYEVSQAQWRQLTFDGGDRPEWTPDGRAITYRLGTSLWQIPSDFSGAAQQLAGTDVAGNAGPFTWSPDGKVLLYGATDGLHAFRPNAAASGAAPADTLVMKRPQEAAAISRAIFSPDGRWVVYTAVETAATFAYVSPFPFGNGGQRKIVNDSVNSPIWRGDEIFINALRGSLGVLGIRTQPALDWKNLTTLFEVQGIVAPSQGTTNYDVTRDGKQVLLIVLDTPIGNTTQEVQIVLNWREELKRLAPAD